jgi:hypothetical protein
MQWLRLIPSEEARQTRRGVRRYFELMGEPIEISDSPENSEEEDEDLDEDGEDEDRLNYMEQEGFEMGEEEYQNHE